MIKSDFWKYVKRFIEKPKEIVPTFNQIVCAEYFRKTLQSMNLTKRFTIPSWIPAFKTPAYWYDIIVFKRCPYLRSYLQLVFKKISCTEQIPSMWKKVVTILIYKKGDQNDAQNFRPIMYQSIPSLTIPPPPGQNPRAIFLMANSPPLGQKWSSKPLPQAYKNELKPHPRAFSSIIHYENMKK